MRVNGRRFLVSAGVTTRTLRAADVAEWVAMRRELWPDSAAAETQAWRDRDDAETLVAERAGQRGLVGFAEVGVRAFADGCETSPVAFLEGWYVRASSRGKGVGGCLIRGAMLWARERGLHELASDSLLDDTAAYLAHCGVGFEEVERAIKYRMSVWPKARAASAMV